MKQPSGYYAFIPSKFPPKYNDIKLDEKTEELHFWANHYLAKLDGITNLLPDIDFFIFMYLRKEAALSNQIEGTRATMIDSIKDIAKLTKGLPDDVKKIQQYIDALNFGLDRLKTLPLSLRLIKEIHGQLLTDIGDQAFTPGEFRTSQNWIGGGSPQTARFVPPPITELNRCLDDFEKFLYAKDHLSPLVKIALAHAQFETIHPFLDGNGRTGRLLIPVYLHKQGLLERPVLYLSEYLKKHREVYFDLLFKYNKSAEILPWLKFFFEGVSTVAQDAIDTSKRINTIRAEDMKTIQRLGQSASIGTEILLKLYSLPIVNVSVIEGWTGYTRQGADKLIKKLINLNILVQKDETKTYGREYVYKRYLDVFTD